MCGFLQQTPVAPFVGTSIKPRIGLTPILRAGLGMTEAMLTLFPDAHVYYLGLFREKVSLRPVECTRLSQLDLKLIKEKITPNFHHLLPLIWSICLTLW